MGDDQAHENDRCGTCRYYGEEPASDSVTSITPVCIASGHVQVIPVATAKDDAVCLHWETEQCETSPYTVLGFPVFYAERSPGAKPAEEIICGSWNDVHVGFVIERE